MPTSFFNWLTQRSGLAKIDWWLFLATLPIIAAGLSTMNSLTGEGSLFSKQLVWLAISFVVFAGASMVDWRFLRRTDVLVIFYLGICLLLFALYLFASATKGAQSWFKLDLISLQPTDLAKLVLILVLAKYFSRRHVEIRHIRHIIVSGVYALIIFLLVLFQPDFGGAIIIFSIWFGMVLVSGISKKHILLVVLIGSLVFAGLWFYGFKDYQKQRILTFIHPLTDIRGSGYNAYQSTIAVGSGGLLGKGVGYGTQSRLKFLPEYQTDFIFAAFAEEWGFIGVVLLFILYAIVFWRILVNAMYGAGNFEILFGLGLAIYLMAHFVVHVGINIGLLPVTGLTIPFMSYGGTHVLTEFLGLGILMGMRRYRRAAHKDEVKNEFLIG